MNPTQTPNRCRIVLIAAKDEEPGRLISAFDGGDVASLILPAWGMDDDAFQLYAEKIVPAAQENGIAVMIAGDARIAMRVQADGLHFEGNRRDLEDLIEKHQSKMMVGTGGATTRDDALNLGEARPDYMFFGKFGYDNKPEPHPRNLKLGEWWSEMIQVPAIVLAGSDAASVPAVAATGADFVALTAAVFAEGTDPAQAVALINAALDAGAPVFED
ncbi:thiamine phosphate synthase [Mesorhizobium sp. CAU 1732]|uniref:thiamine phosphate synthase n=1 Tax=Mesorhizobium sp. CAU 1732 TaxID=3140358 RepID=UPI003261AC8F